MSLDPRIAALQLRSAILSDALDVLASEPIGERLTKGSLRMAAEHASETYRQLTEWVEEDEEAEDGKPPAIAAPSASSIEGEHYALSVAAHGALGVLASALNGVAQLSLDDDDGEVGMTRGELSALFRVFGHQLESHIKGLPHHFGRASHDR